MINWRKYPKEKPRENVGVLVRTDPVGPVYDVAVFVGILPNGEHRWILSDIHLDQKSITHFAYIYEPPELRTIPGLKLKILKTYKANNGDLVTITGTVPYNRWGAVYTGINQSDGCGYGYSSDGLYDPSDPDHALNLVEEVEE